MNITNMAIKHIFDVSIQYGMNSMNMNMIYSSSIVVRRER